MSDSLRCVTCVFKLLIFDFIVVFAYVYCL